MTEKPKQELQKILDRNADNEEFLLRLLRCARAYEKALNRKRVQTGQAEHHT